MNRLRKSRSSSGVAGLGAQSGTDGVASQSNPAAGSLPSFPAFGVPFGHGFRAAYAAAGVPPAGGFIPTYPTGPSSTAPSAGEAPTASCGGRNRRPPVAPSSIGVGMDNDIELTDASTAFWSDERTRIVCDIFAEEVLIGNRSSTHLNKAGYNNVIQKFKTATGLEYTRKQFKNKWERLKSDHSIWKQLKAQTGLGWDGNGNINMTDEWWKKMSKEIKGSGRFKTRGLQNEEKLEIMFENLHNTGEDHWCASSGVPPSQSYQPSEEEEEEEEEDNSEPDPGTPTGGAKRRNRLSDNSKGKQPKTSKGSWLLGKVERMVEMNERTTRSCESIARSVKEKVQFVCSIQEVMALVKDCGAVPGTNEHFIATTIFTKKVEREMFMTLENREERFEWLSKKYEWMAKH
ncbi:hypothetical protein GQ55_4G066300 [Panicum hallii var. hallii]|uniref:Myb/SANT-like domain-containing protein n=1 Tax=Panicum hallii var. hallii TaxID=1504633 RepID=A0A2T7DVY8_9POAL|nr:hypothetical protein GQ55_4G066300 [Panicum hallii var. hallii]